MELYISHTGSLIELAEGLKHIENQTNVESILVLACDENGFTPETCDSVFRQIQKPLFGGIFPGIIHENTKLDQGTLIIGLTTRTNTHIIKNISNSDLEFEDIIEELHKDDFEFQTMAVIVDGFSKRIGALIEALFVVFGLEYNYFGGGAGSLKNRQPCIISNEGLLIDSALIVELKTECGVGVQHGWKSIAGPFKITSSEENIIQTIDFKPAFEVYKEIIDTHSKEKITTDNFFEIAKAYPFGINKLGAEKVVRDPLSNDGNNLICVGDVPEGAFIDVLNGNKDTLINAAKTAADISSNQLNANETEFVLFFDCISRVLFLENDFTNELKAVNTENVPLVGALSIGEIANNRKDYLEFYNKTAVVASIKKAT